MDLTTPGAAGPVSARARDGGEPRRGAGACAEGLAGGGACACERQRPCACEFCHRNDGAGGDDESC